MKLLIYVIPVAFLVTYSQLVVKWRSRFGGEISIDKNFLSNLIGYLSDFYILSAYAAALLGSFLWLVVISRIPLSIGFPIYIGVTFLMVIIGSWLFLGESLSMIRLAAVGLILAGIVLGGTKL